MAHGTIIAIEDDLGVANMLRLYFLALGYDLKVVRKGKLGLAAVVQNVPDLVLLDVVLPDIDGYTVYRGIRANSRTHHVPVIFLTQKDDRNDRLIGLEMGAYDYITKPFDVEELRLRVERAIQRNRQQSLVNPRTGLPARGMLGEQVRQRVGETGWALLNCNISSFQQFTDVYGFLASDEVLRFTSQLIRKVVGDENAKDFIGHTEDDEFVIILSDGSRAKSLAHVLTTQFGKEVRAHYSFADREQGHMLVGKSDGRQRPIPLMSLTVTITRPHQLFSEDTEI